MREEKAIATTNGRLVLKLLFETIGNGDKLAVWKLDRLTRNMRVFATSKTCLK
ncbi:recombinase family protein [Desulfovibrio caledoniensis]